MTLEETDVASSKKEKSRQAARPAAAAGPLARFLRGRWLALWVVLLLGIFALQAITSMAQKSSTWDESAHLPAGWTYLATGDYRMNPEHPPLAKMIAALPLMFMKINGALDTQEWRDGKEWDYGWDFLYTGRNDAATLLFWGRFSMVILSLCLGLLIFFWARKLYGNAAGLFALFLFAFSPNLIAHGSLANTDLPIAFFMALSLFCFDRAAWRLTPLSAGLAGVTLGLALLTKFSAPLLLPIMLVVAVFRLFDRRPMEVRFRGPSVADTWRKKAVAFLVLFCVAIALAYAVVWAGYRFRYCPYADGVERPLWFSNPMNPPQSPIYRFLHYNHVLPHAYLEGFRYVGETTVRYAYLDGRHNWDDPYHAASWPHYFIMTTLYKTPVAALIFFIVAVGGAFWWSRKTWPREVALIAGIIIYFAAASLSGMYIGHRHILPVIPLAIILTGKIVNHLRPRQRIDAIVIRSAFAILALWCVFSAASIYPNYLAYFNEIAGGPGNGPKHLSDSNIDWGQDLPLLKKYIDDNRIDYAHLIYFGNADPRYYGVRCRFFTAPAFWPDNATRQTPSSDLSEAAGVRIGDYFAVSATLLDETFPMPDRRVATLVRKFRDEEPVAKIGYSIYIYKSPISAPAVPIEEIDKARFQPPPNP